MKKFLSIFLSFTMLFTVAPLSGVCDAVNKLTESIIVAQAKEVFNEGFCGDTSDGSDGKNLSWYLDADGVLTISGVGKMTDASPWKDDLRVTKVIIENGVTSIGNEAFYGCTNMTYVTMADSVLTIGKYSFYNCSKLSEIYFSSSITSIDSYCFSHCGLKTIDLPNITKISPHCFYYSKLESIVIPDSVKTISGYAFDYSSKLTSVTLGHHVEIIEDYAFSRCDLRELNIPDNVTCVEDRAFFVNRNLERVNIGSGLQTLYEGAFDSCSDNLTITISPSNPNLKCYDGVIYNSDYSKIIWVNDARTTSLTFPKELVINDNIIYVLKDTHISEFLVEEGNTSIKSIDGIIYSYNVDKILKCPYSYSEDVVIPDSVTIVGSYCFFNCDKLKSVTFNDNITEIGTWAFGGSVVENGEYILGAGTKTIKKYAFTSAFNTWVGKQKGHIELNEGLETIEDYALLASNIDVLVIPDSVKSIGALALYDSYFTDLYIGAGVKYISSSMGRTECKKFEVSPDNTTYASYEGALYTKDLKKLLFTPLGIEEVIIPAETETINIDSECCNSVSVSDDNPYLCDYDNMIFNKDVTKLLYVPRCGEPRDIVIPETVKIIGNEFEFRDYVTSIHLPDGLESLGVFSHCSSLTQINIPPSIKTIRNESFSSCINLKEITIPEGITSIGYRSFYNCGVTDLTIPSTVVKMEISPNSYLKNITILNPYCKLETIDNLPSKCVVKAYCGSTAHRMAVQRKVSFISLGHDYLDWYTYTPATYEADGIERRDCAYCDGYEERIIPRLKQETHTATFVADGKVVSVVNFYDTMTEIEEPAVPTKDRYIGEWEDYTLGNADIIVNAKYTLIKSDNAENIKTESKIDYYFDTDDICFNIKASAAAKTVKTVNSESVPLDIVLVVDQSGSMAETLDDNQRKVDVLKKTVTSFVSLVADNAKQTATDHRIAIVGFGNAGNRKGYELNENTELLTSATGTPVAFQKTNTHVYAGAMVDVLKDDNVNPIITNAIESIDARGATAADRGLEMAKGIYSSLGKNSRERIVVFLTDGEPTYKNGFDVAVANSAISNAKILKKTYNASIYSVGIFDYAQQNNNNIKRFMSAVSSDYPDASSFKNIAERQSDHYFTTVDSTDVLSDVFKTVATESLYHTAPFENITIIKTLSQYVTLTSKQEQELRVSLLRRYGITDNDISITKNEDGTTTIKVSNLSPYEVVAQNGDITYEVTFDFFASLNENATTAGDYYVDTEDSGVILGNSNAYEATFETSKVTVESDKTRFIFKINDEVYDITEGTSPSEAIPETDFSNEWNFSGWNTANASTQNGTVLNATLEKKNRSIVWHTADGDITQYYIEGDTITPPNVSNKEDGSVFLSWDRSLPTTMLDNDLEFTAVYGEHVHKYVSEIVKPATCTETGITKYVCVCGDCSTQTVPATNHNFEAITPSTKNDVSKCTFVCTNCGLKYDYALNYEIVNSSNWHSKVEYNFQLTDDDLQTGFEPDETISIRIPLSKFQTNAKKVDVVRTNEDGSKTVLPSRIEDGYLIVLTDHFSPYEIKFDFDCNATGEHIDEDDNGYCDYCSIEYSSDNSALVAAIEKANDFVYEDYSKETLNNLNSVVDEYFNLSQENALQSEYDTATKKILEAIYDLKAYLNLDISAPNGAFTVTYNGETNSNNNNSLLFGTNVTVTATANEGYEFVGWYDTINNLYFSKNAEYSFKLTTNTSLKAVFVKDQSATLTFTTYSNWVQSTVTKTIDEWNAVTSIDELLPAVPYRYGYTNGRWVYDNAEVLAKLQTGEDVYLIPEYDKDDTSLPTPPSPDGDTPVLDLYYKLDADANVGSFVMAAGIPENCQLESVGILFYYKNADEFDPTKFELLINNKMLAGRFNTDEIEDIYIVNMNKMSADKNWAARGYVTYYDAEGNLKTVYSNQVNIVNREQV